jgi:hypothetical protein
VVKPTAGLVTVLQVLWYQMLVEVQGVRRQRLHLSPETALVLLLR